ncbi:MAG: hypothetical protein ACEY3L_13385 [Wolbachia sp.]
MTWWNVLLVIPVLLFLSSQCSDTGIHFSIIRNVDYFYTRKFNWIPVSEHWDDTSLKLL